MEQVRVAHAARLPNHIRSLYRRQYYDLRLLLR